MSLRRIEFGPTGESIPTDGEIRELVDRAVEDNLIPLRYVATIVGMYRIINQLRENLGPLVSDASPNPVPTDPTQIPTSAETLPDGIYGAREPDDNQVICPACTHQFRGIPINIQARLDRINAINRSHSRYDEEIDKLSLFPWLNSIHAPKT